MNRLALALLLFAVPAFADPPPMPPPSPPAVILPDAPTPTPPPVPIPGTSTALGADQLYVVRGPVVPLILHTWPVGLLKVTSLAGPLTVRARFTDGDGTYQTRVLTEPFIYTVEAVGKGRCELLIVPTGAKTEADLVWRTIDAGGITPVPPGPTPPGPTPPVPPIPPTPSPAPIPAPGLHVLVVYKATDLAKITPGQYQALYGAAIRAYLNAHCVLGPDGKTHEWRVWEDGVATDAESPLWIAAMARPRKSLPWLIVSNPDKGGGYEGPLPAVLDDTMAILKKYGGE